MEPGEMGRIWAAHYYKHHSNVDSHRICTSICSLIRAQASTNVNLKATLARILGEAGISMEQFEECEAEP
jgi:hypothetical protein